MANFAYLRVSTDEQDTNNQKHGLLEYSNERGLAELEFIVDSVTGKKPWRERKLGTAIEEMKAGDNLVFAEVSRMARSTLQVLEILSVCAEKEINVYIAKQRMVLDGSMQAKITATVLGLAAEIEREFISQRTKEALAARKAAGMKLGRPNKPQERYKLDEHRKDIEKYLDKGLSLSAISKLVDSPRSTLSDYIRRRDLRT
ncbi:recombinase family protein [Vibrio sp. 10N.286.46.E10]|uniref:recombinase family protein n=1 Tax=Vibrio sp. 10N.286.46.E10 TaxID=1884477 RepID=UPI000C866B85|nr:recombinase family protein [Vibrio sp. 10N.286.46.E10]PMI24288.1 resolvase [Vibrio sp. 10N.286.46.E10]